MNSPSAQRLRDKVALVTGAANGIGLAITEAFFREGALVLLTDLDEEACRKQARRLDPEGLHVFYKKCDVRSQPEVNAVVQWALDRFRRIDILVNNAAVAISGNVMEMPDADWDRLMDTNLKSMFRTIRATLPSMVAAGRGSVINLSSTQAFRSWENWTAYAAAKGAVVAMTRQLAGQFGRHQVRFNTLSPGAILTPMNARRAAEEGPEFLAQSAAQHALERLGTPEEVAMSAVFLASDESGFVTGSDLRVDGGLSVLPRWQS